MSEAEPAPSWWNWALNQLGVSEVPGKGSNGTILNYRKLAKIAIGGDDSDIAWCAIFANAALEVNGIRGTRSTMARSFEKSLFFEKLTTPIPGCIVTKYRKSLKSGLGHVGFYRGETKDGKWVALLGGNQNDKVSIQWFDSKYITGYYWPANVPKPKPRRLILDRGGKTPAVREV